MKRFVLFTILIIFMISIPSCNGTQQPEIDVKPTVTRLVSQPTTSPSCRSFGPSATPVSVLGSTIPAIKSTDHIRGPEDAPVTILAYGDLQTELSGQLSQVVNRLVDQNLHKVRFVSRIFPLVGQKDKTVLATQAVEAANLQNKFWELHDLLYSQQEGWVDLSVDDFEQWVTAQASAMGMDVDQFQTDLKSEAVFNLIKVYFDEGQDAGVFGVPLVIINGEVYIGPQDYVSLNDIVQLILLGERQFRDCPPMTVQKTKQYLATLQTEKGDVVIQLFPDKAPFTVNSFIFLAQNGWYEDITFHRVVPVLYAQTGDPSGTGKGTPGYFVVTEILPDLTFDKPGMVAMVNSGPDSSGSQFFITYDAAPQFDGQYTIFGQVLSGMDVLKSLTPRDIQIGVETPPGDKLMSVTIEEN
jgi:cyclophilin family peptidyl-prolyl cis-trans isomerase/protein-disulfide isomerase